MGDGLKRVFAPWLGVKSATHPKLARGQVWCKTCGATRNVNSEGAMRDGWPKCCGHTMTIDAPDEREPSIR